MYKYKGAEALVNLHDREMRLFLKAWAEARKAGLPVPKCEDPDYRSLEHLLCHVLRASRGYLTWICECLRVPAPPVEPAPEPEAVAACAETYLEHLLAAWATPLTGMTEEQAYTPDHTSRWKVKYCLDAMLEHAVMHPVRHRYQLENWRAAAPKI